MRELYIDLGFDSADEVRALGIQVGDAIAYEAPMRRLANPNRLSGKALDNRIACALIVELAERLASASLGCTLHLVVTVQEEVGLRGAKMVTHRLNPTAAIIVDTMPAGGTPDTSATKDLAAQMGKGPVLTLVSQGGASGMIVQPGLRDFLNGVAEPGSDRRAASLFYGGNSDAAAVHLVNAGIPTRPSTSPAATLTRPWRRSTSGTRSARCDCSKRPPGVLGRHRPLVPGLAAGLGEALVRGPDAVQGQARNVFGDRGDRAADEVGGATGGDHCGAPANSRRGFGGSSPRTGRRSRGRRPTGCS